MWLWCQLWICFAVYCQARERISVSAGSDILLPCKCSYEPGIDVYWRYEDSVIVYNIDSSKPDQPDLAYQDQRFRNRIISFPNLYSQGNFSLVLKNVSLSDAGSYHCVTTIPTTDCKQLLELNVTAEKPPAEPSDEVPTEAPADQSRVSGGSGIKTCDVITMAYMLSIVMFSF